MNPQPSSRPARALAAGLALAALVITGAACSSSGSDAAAKPPSTTATTARPSTSTVPPTATSGTGTGPNPCTIVTAADVQAITGAAATPTGPTTENRGSVCKWDPGTGSSVLVQVYVGKAFYDPAVQAPKAQKLSGIGDDAYLDDFAPARAAVGFLKGDVAVFIDGLQVTSSDAVVAAARDAVTKI